MCLIHFAKHLAQLYKMLYDTKTYSSEFMLFLSINFLVVLGCKNVQQGETGKLCVVVYEQQWENSCISCPYMYVKWTSSLNDSKYCCPFVFLTVLTSESCALIAVTSRVLSKQLLKRIHQMLQVPVELMLMLMLLLLQEVN